MLSLTVAALLFTTFTVTVEADAKLPRPASTLPPAAPPQALLPRSAMQPTSRAFADPLLGIASWYGKQFEGRTTASGEPFHMHAMTACNNKLPFGTIVRVVNITNHRSVVVRINDRGALVPGRIIDLSYGAAKKLHFAKAGLAFVELEILSFGKPHQK
jgi:rare lipoprotein A